MNTIDFFVGIMMILSVVLSVLRGFTREVLTIVGFVGSAIAVIYGLPIVGPMFGHCSRMKPPPGLLRVLR